MLSGGIDNLIVFINGLLFASLIFALAFLILKKIICRSPGIARLHTISRDVIGWYKYNPLSTRVSVFEHKREPTNNL